MLSNEKIVIQNCTLVYYGKQRSSWLLYCLCVICLGSRDNAALSSLTDTVLDCPKRLKTLEPQGRTGRSGWAAPEGVQLWACMSCFKSPEEALPPIWQYGVVCTVCMSAPPALFLKPGIHGCVTRAPGFITPALIALWLGHPWAGPMRAERPRSMSNLGKWQQRCPTFSSEKHLSWFSKARELNLSQPDSELRSQGPFCSL